MNDSEGENRCIVIRKKLKEKKRKKWKIKVSWFLQGKAKIPAVKTY